MVEPIFQAPPPPPMNHDDLSQAGQNSSENQMDEVQNDNTSNQSVSQEPVQPLSQKEVVLRRLNELKENFVRYFWYSVGGLFLLGMFFGCAMSGNEAPPKKQQSFALTKITKNPSEKKYKICGDSSILPSDPCYYYILNGTNHEKKAEDFFEEVAIRTNRSFVAIQTSNIFYLSQRIPSGYFAEIIVPAKR